MSVPFFDMKRHLSAVRTPVDEALSRVLDDCSFIQGPDVVRLESEIAQWVGVTGGVGVSSGTDALLAALMALDVGPGDEVVTTPFTFFATAGTVHRLGARLVFADIEPETFNLDPGLARDVTTSKTRVVIPVHLFGHVAEMSPLLEWAGEGDRRAVLEDAAQSIGASGPLGPAGAVGTCGTYSFFPAKNLGCIGDGGMVVSRDGDLLERVRMLRNHGSRPKYYHSLVGGNFRLDTVQAAVLRVMLPHLDQWTRRRRAVAARYGRLFDEAGLTADGRVALPVERSGYRHVFNQYVIRVPDREGLMAWLKGAGVGHAVYYPLGLHVQACFEGLGYEPGDFPATEQASRECLAIPVFPEITDAEQDEVVGVIKDFYDTV